MFDDDDDEIPPAAPASGSGVPRPRLPDVPLPPRPATPRRGAHGGCADDGAAKDGCAGNGRMGDDDSGDDDSGDGGARALLEGLAGVRAGEETGQAAPRTRPRLSVEPVHALIVMAILVVMLAASLTLLVQQSVNLADASPEPTPVTASSRAAADDDAPSCASSAPASSAQGQPDATPQSQPTQQAAPQATPQLIDLNTATQEQLETVKGVGPVTAANIIAYRTSVGRFGAVDDLLNIDGIGPKTLEKIRGQVTVR